MKSVKNEKLFCFFYDKNYLGELSPNDTGRKQFFDDQSNGIKPTNPDKYYLQLDSGKCNYDIYTRTLQQEHLKNLTVHNYHTNVMTGWWGWNMLYHDWEKEKWILPFITDWANSLIDVDKFCKTGEVEYIFKVEKKVVSKDEINSWKRLNRMIEIEELYQNWLKNT